MCIVQHLFFTMTEFEFDVVQLPVSLQQNINNRFFILTCFLFKSGKKSFSVNLQKTVGNP